MNEQLTFGLTPAGLWGIPAEKRCSRCGETKPVEEMAWQRKKPHLAPRPKSLCKACNRLAASEWRGKNPERMWAVDKSYRDRNREKRKDALARWRQANPERIRFLARRNQQRRAVGRDALSLEYADVLRNDPCAYCGGPGGLIEHMEPVSRGGTSEWTNLTATCRSCNVRKTDNPMLLALGGWRRRGDTFIHLDDLALCYQPGYAKRAA